MEKPIYVTQPSLPALEEFIPYLEKIWESKILTNNGPMHKQLEKELAEFLGVPFISLFANGTLALVTALQALRITGEVITSPFSFVATTHSLWWNNIKPVFVDIEPQFGNLDPMKIEAAITPKTTAIMPVHVYGNPCHVERIQQIADTIMAPGINSKMNEVQAAMGLLQLKSIDKDIEKRKSVAKAYRELLKNIKGITMLSEPVDTISNYAYFPIFVNEKEYGMSRDSLYDKLKANNIYGRRYFYPLISEFSMYKSLESSSQNNLPVSHKMANEVICLPIYSELETKTVQFISELLK